jgi:ABC-type phosphate transport system auxiliary subunit
MVFENRNEVMIRRLAALGINDEAAVIGYKRTVKAIDVLLIKAQQKSAELDEQIAHALFLEKKIRKIRVKDLDLTSTKLLLDQTHVAISGAINQGTMDKLGKKISLLQARKKRIDDTILSITYEINSGDASIEE